MPKYKLLDQAQSLVELRGYLNFNPKLDLFRLLLGYTFLFCKTKSIFSSKKEIEQCYKIEMYNTNKFGNIEKNKARWEPLFQSL